MKLRSNTPRAPMSVISIAVVLVLGVLLTAGASLACARGHAEASSGAPLIGPYFGSPFTVEQNRYSFGQAASWTSAGTVLSAQLDSTGVRQIYRADVDGSRQRCLTCGRVAGPSGLPQERTQADWILFESYAQQPTHVGTPGLGGYGGDLYVMHEDGSHPYRLTTSSDPNHGLRYTATGGVPYDNFHAYWSPDGNQIIWTHTEARPLADGGQTWEMLIGDFRIRHGVPSLSNVRVVGRPYGVYETQPWAPDGSGFLFSAAGGRTSPYQSTDPGWGHMQLYFMRLYGRGASPGEPRITQISDDGPAYNEQAVFTPDMKTVIMMSNRTKPQGSWYDLVIAAAQRTWFDAPDTGSSQTLQFLSDFAGSDFNSDLYAVDVQSKAIRRLTHFTNGVVPEFFWNRRYTKIIMSVGTSATAGPNGSGDAVSTWIGQFEGIGPWQRRVPTQIPAPGLFGVPADMARVGLQAQGIRDPGPTDDAPAPVPAPTVAAPAEPHATSSSDHPSVPAVTVSYLTLWLHDLDALFRRSGQSFTAPPLLGALSRIG